MKLNIFNYDQEKLIEHGVSLHDALFLDWFSYWFASGTMDTTTHEGQTFAWVSHQYVIDQLPILGITTAAGMKKFIRRLRDNGLLESTTVHNQDRRGQRAFYRPSALAYSLHVDNSRKTEGKNSVQGPASTPEDSVQGPASTPEDSVSGSRQGPSYTPSVKNTPTLEYNTTSSSSDGELVDKYELPSGRTVPATPEVVEKQKRRYGTAEVHRLLEAIANHCEETKGDPQYYRDYAKQIEPWAQRQKLKPIQHASDPDDEDPVVAAFWRRHFQEVDEMNRKHREEVGALPHRFSGRVQHMAVGE